MVEISTILGLITAHMFGDYAFQSQYIAETKKKNLYHLIVHCWIYTFCIWVALALLNKMNWHIILTIFGTHFIIDYLKGRFSDKLGEKAYFLDQVLHYAIILVISIFLTK